MTALRLPILFAAVILASGCLTLRDPEPDHMLPERPPVPAMERQPGDYTVHIRVMDMPGESKNLLYTNPNLYADQVRDMPETHTVPMPDLYLAPGETRTIDTRKAIPYPSAFDEDGKIKAYETDTIGLQAVVKLELDNERGLVLNLNVKDANPVWMREYQAPNGSRYARPVIDTVSVNTRGVVTTYNEWNVLTGGSVPVVHIRKTQTGTVETRRFNTWRIVLVRIMRAPRQDD